MDKEAFNRQLKEETEWIGKITREFLPKDIVYQKTIADAMEYSLMAGGKRLRPLLMQETFRMFGGTTDAVELFMAAIEMIHTY